MQQQQPSGQPGSRTIPHKIQITIIAKEGKGNCPNGHKVGDVFIVNRKSPTPPLCLAALFNLLNPIRIFEGGGSYPHYPDPDSYQMLCPDIGQRMLFEVRRLPEEADDPSH
jgi:uncharacterized repeat protein (TIGR04076 family)